MLDGLLDLVLKVFFTLAGLVSSVLITPILAIFRNVFPDLNAYLSTTLTFWNRVLNGVAFGKEVFLNITGFPRAFLNAIITYWFARFSLMVIKRAFKFIKNIYFIVRGQKLEG